MQIGNDYSGIAVNRDVRQRSKMCQPAGNGGLMAGTVQMGANGLVADRPGEVRTAVEYGIFRKNCFGIVSGAGIGARRVAGDQIIDFEPIFNGADARF